MPGTPKGKGRRSWDGGPLGGAATAILGRLDLAGGARRKQLDLHQGLHSQQVRALHERLRATGFLALHWFGVLDHLAISLDPDYQKLTASS